MAWRPSEHRPPVPVAVLACAAAAAAILLKRTVFPHLSINSDEAINAFFADTLVRGRMFPPTMGDPDAFRPWLAATSGDHYVLKYTPVVAGLIAASTVVAGGPELYLGVLGAATVAATYLLASEVLRDRSEAVVATALVALSPLVLIQSGLLLSYLPTFVLLELFAWGLLRGIATGRAWVLAVAGLTGGLATFVRTFDAVVFAAPLLLWAVIAMRRGAPVRPALLAWLAGAGAVPIAAFAAFNTAASGSPLRLPFSLLEPADALGFGRRRLYPTDTMRSFGLREGLSGVLQHGILVNWWVTGGTVLIVLAVATLVRRRADGRMWALVAAGVLIPVTYTFFWGPWNAAVLWGGDRYFGPFYFLPVLLPLALCGARGLVDLFRWRRPLGAAVAAAMAVVSATTMVVAVGANRAFSVSNQALHRLVQPPPGAAPRLVFVDPPAPFLMHPSAVVRNRSDLSGPVVFAVSRGEEDLDVLRRFPDRGPYRLRFEAAFTDHRQELGATLDAVAVVRAPTLSLRLTITGPGVPTTLELTAAGVTTTYPMPAATSSHDLLLTPGAAQLGGAAPQSTRRSASPGVEVRLIRTGNGTVIAEERLPLRTSGGTLEVLLPQGNPTTSADTGPPRIVVTAIGG